METRGLSSLFRDGDVLLMSITHHAAHGRGRAAVVVVVVVVVGFIFMGGGLFLKFRPTHLAIGDR